MYGRTALFIACEFNSTRSAAALIDAGADVGIRDQELRTPLMVCGDVGIAQRLLDLGADVDATDVDNHTALAFSIMNGNTEMVSFLLKA
jgi:ankyrin repeat protein